MALITANQLTIGYDREPVAENINFSVCEGDYLCVIGENGAGKSTLIKTILGLLKPLSGTITFDDGLTKNGISIRKLRFPEALLFLRKTVSLVKRALSTHMISGKRKTAL